LKKIQREYTTQCDAGNSKELVKKNIRHTSSSGFVAKKLMFLSPPVEAYVDDQAHNLHNIPCSFSPPPLITFN
jgi:hypothetical protein